MNFLDLNDLCATLGTARGEFPSDRFLRLLDDGIRLDAPVGWELSAGVMPRHLRPQYAGCGTLTLVFEVRGTAPCARCLQALPFALKREQRYVLFDSDAQADAAPLDDDEFDPLVRQTPFDVLGLIEDELLLAFDPMPRHTRCPSPDDDETHASHSATHRPFAALSKLRKN